MAGERRQVVCEPRVLRLIALLAPLYAALVWAGIHFAR